MLNGRMFEYFPKLKFIRINGLPPNGWEDLSSEEHFKEINKLVGFSIEVTSVQFDY